jgi:hypothetical protein
MVMDAHNKAFAFFGGVPLQVVYDNLKTVVDTVFVGKERKFNRQGVKFSTRRKQPLSNITDLIFYLTFFPSSRWCTSYNQIWCLRLG